MLALQRLPDNTLQQCVYLDTGCLLYTSRRTGAPWRLFFIGAVTFIASQVLHIPFNAVVLRSGLLSTDTTVWSSLIIYCLLYTSRCV